jgi:hypothetical protein
MHETLVILGYAASAVVVLGVIALTVGEIFWALTGEDRFTVSQYDDYRVGKFAAQVIVRVHVKDIDHAKAIAQLALGSVGVRN